MRSARNKKELKDKIQSVRMSYDQNMKIKENAAKHKMSIGSYMVMKAVNDDDEGMSPSNRVEFQDLINTALIFIQKHEPEKFESYGKRALKIRPK